MWSNNKRIVSWAKVATHGDTDLMSWFCFQMYETGVLFIGPLGDVEKFNHRYANGSKWRLKQPI